MSVASFSLSAKVDSSVPSGPLIVSSQQIRSLLRLFFKIYKSASVTTIKSKVFFTEPGLYTLLSLCPVLLYQAEGDLLAALKTSYQR